MTQVGLTTDDSYVWVPFLFQGQYVVWAIVKPFQTAQIQLVGWLACLRTWHYDDGIICNLVAFWFVVGFISTYCLCFLDLTTNNYSSISSLEINRDIAIPSHYRPHWLQGSSWTLQKRACFIPVEADLRSSFRHKQIHVFSFSPCHLLKKTSFGKQTLKAKARGFLGFPPT